MDGMIFKSILIAGINTDIRKFRKAV